MVSGPSAGAGTTGSSVTIVDTGMIVRMVTAASAGIPTKIAISTGVMTATAVGRMVTVHVVISIPTGMADTGIMAMITTVVGRGMAIAVPVAATSGTAAIVIVARASAAMAIGVMTGGLTVGRMSGLAVIAHGRTVRMGTVPAATAPMVTVPAMTIVKAVIGATVPMATGTRASMVVMIAVVMTIAMTTAARPISVTARMAMTAVAAILTGPSPIPRRTPTRIVGLASPRCPRAWNGPCSPRMIACACVG